MPTEPLAGNSRWARWNRLTEVFVIDPKKPVAGTE